jgi:hypothetical protein
MPKDIQAVSIAALSALQELVANGGDKFTWSMSKTSRIWMSLSYWGTSSYTTSVELDPLDEEDAIIPALVVLLHTHALKRFHGAATNNSWLDVAGTRNSVDIAGAWFRNHPRLVKTPEEPEEDATTT